jgi:subtilisin family serine protease
MIRRVAGLGLGVLLVLLAAAVPTTGVGAADGRSGRYIVVLHDRTAHPSEVAEGHARRFGAQVGFVYSAALKGYAATLSDRALARVTADPAVAYVEADGPVSIVGRSAAKPDNPGNGGGGGGGDSDTTACSQVLPWGVDRVDADLNTTLLAGDCTGARTNVNVYVIDTGVYKHRDLNVVNHVNFAGGRNQDCHGHGTHVAGTVAARDNTVDVVGVFPGAPVTGVKVLNCAGSGTWSGVIAGIDWVTQNAVKPAVANMSLGGGANTAVDNAVRASAASGVTYAVAAGNSGANACNSSPARAGTTNGVVTVAATDSLNREASWSNYGSCVDIWAPGVSILSTRLKGGTTTMSGTSMASPHVAGSAAAHLTKNTAASPSTVEAALKNAAVATGTTSKDGAAIRLVNVASF